MTLRDNVTAKLEAGLYRGVFPSNPMVFFDSVFCQGTGIHVEILHSSSMFSNPLREIFACLSNTRLATVSTRNLVYTTTGFLWKGSLGWDKMFWREARGLKAVLPALSLWLPGQRRAIIEKEKGAWLGASGGNVSHDGQNGAERGRSLTQVDIHTQAEGVSLALSNQLGSRATSARDRWTSGLNSAAEGTVNSPDMQESEKPQAAGCPNHTWVRGWRDVAVD